MLHILLIILKIAGIIFAAILGILILLLAVVLFVPVRYEAAGKCNGTMDSLKIRAGITWFFHLAGADLLYKNRSLKWRFHFAWIKGGKTEKNETKEFAHQEISEIPEAPEKTENIERAEPKDPETVQKDDAGSKDGPEIKSASEPGAPAAKRPGFLQKIKKAFRKIGYKIRRICDKIKMLSEKKERLTDFIQNAAHKDAFHKAKRAILRMLSHILPKKGTADILYGFDDPYMTGKVLAGLGMLYPVLGPYAEITPDFEKKVLKGRVYVRGHIRGCHFLLLFLRLILCRNIRLTYRDIRNYH